MAQLSVSGNANGGFIEGDIAYRARWGVGINNLPLPWFGNLAVSDSGSPVPNFRTGEAFMALVALAHTGPLVNVQSYIGCGGTYEAYGHIWGLKPKKNKFWLKFYNRTELMERIDAKFAPISSGVYKAISARKIAILKMWLSLVPHLGFRSIPRLMGYEIKLFEKKFARMPLSEVAEGIPEGGVILTFPCPVCSHQKQTTVYHAIRRRENGIVISKSDRAPSTTGCKGGLSWKEMWNSLTVWQAAFYLGARLSGKATYYMESTELFKPGMIIRDYSNPRGTIATTVKAWSRHLWISPRVYLVGGEKTSITDFQRSLAKDPKGWANVIKKFPLLGNGQEWTVTF